MPRKEGLDVTVKDLSKVFMNFQGHFTVCSENVDDYTEGVHLASEHLNIHCV